MVSLFSQRRRTTWKEQNYIDPHVNDRLYSAKRNCNRHQARELIAQGTTKRVGTCAYVNKLAPEHFMPLGRNMFTKRGKCSLRFRTALHGAAKRIATTWRR